MAFKLECAGSLRSSNCTEVEINRAFDEDHLRGEFIILTAPNGDFLQAANDGDSPFILEYRTASTEEHITVEGKLTKEQTRGAFLAFLRGDQSWRSAHTWKPLAESTGKSGCVGVLFLAVSAAILAATLLR